MANRTINREQEEHIIAGASGAIMRINRGYKVLSQSGNGSYDVVSRPLGWDCSCPDHKFRGVKCKHMFAVEISFALRKQVEVARIEPIPNINNCIYCHSIIIVKDGLRHNKYGDIQKFNCKECGKYFTINIGFEKMKHNPQGITTAMQLYFSGESLRNTCESLQLIGMSASHQTIYNWIKKYVTWMARYLEKNITKYFGCLARPDELYLKVRGNPKYLYALMDDETRFWIARQVAETKYTSNIQPLFKHAKRIARKRPNTLITDGAPNFAIFVR